MASQVTVPINKEDEIGRKWDRCLTDLVLKFSGGVLIGGVFSLLICKRKSWPLYVGGAFGIGMAYSNCERDLNLSLAPTCTPTPKNPNPNPNAKK